MRFSEPLAVLGLTGVGLAAPYTPNGASLIEGWQAFSGLFNGVNNALTVTVSELLDELGDALNKGDRAKTLDTLEKLKPTIKLKSIADASSITEKSQSQANGTASESTNDLLSHAQGFGSAENGNDNRNPNPPKSVYPKAASCDAPYSLSEDKLRSAIYIPDTFTYGEKLPVILFPGTGATGWTSLRGNFIPLLTDVDWADPVRVNVPGLLLDDGQVNAEYAAYAINYIASLSKRSVSIIGWSQSHDRSCRHQHGLPGHYPSQLCRPFRHYQHAICCSARSWKQFHQDLRSNGSDSGYVPTTSLYSSF